MFKHLISTGAGRPVDKDGFPLGPWTPELLAEAISNIEANRAGIDLRTVQHWFQDNAKGISPDNIRWLARIFGCGDPEAAGEWQAELSAANRRLAEKRKREKAAHRPQEGSSDKVQGVEDGNTHLRASAGLEERRNWLGFLAGKTEALFGSQSSMTLPLVVFSGACILALISFSLNIHSVVFTPEDSPPKQVGFLWAPNWTIVFLAVLPLYLAWSIELLGFWKEEWRPRLATLGDPASPNTEWEHRLFAASYLFAATLIVTVIVASGYNWTVTHLVPLLNGDPGALAINWGRLAIVRPDLISVPSAISFSGLVFLYNGFTAYLFFAGLIFLHLMKHDYLDLVKGLETSSRENPAPEIAGIGFSLMSGIFRCTVLGVVITVLMKLQSAFLQSSGVNIVDWLLADFRSPFGNHDYAATEGLRFGSAPGSYYSFFCLLAIVGTFANASIQIRRTVERLHGISSRRQSFAPWLVMNGTMAVLVVSYFLIGLLPGFTIFLGLSLVLTGYVLSRLASNGTNELMNRGQK